MTRSSLEMAAQLAAIRSDFERLMGTLEEGGLARAAQSLTGFCLVWGEELKAIYALEEADKLADRDPLTRFFILRFRGMAEPPDFSDAPPQVPFLLALRAFPYLDVMDAQASLGDLAEPDEEGRARLHRLVAGEPDGEPVTVMPGNPGWMFDLMPVYVSKAEAMHAFISEQFQGDFDAFFNRYLADHDLAFDMTKARLPFGPNVTTETGNG